jgi:fluoroacetyl-CoA thioesterase
MSEAGGAKIEPGLEGSIERVIPLEWTLAHYDPKLPAVFSTPAMIGLMEIAASHTIWPALPHGALTVGTRIEVDHLKAVPAGVTLVAKAKLVEVNGRRLIFEVEVWHGTNVIGRGRVHRAIVEHARFAAIAAEKSPAS